MAKRYDYWALAERWAEKYLKPRKVPGNAYAPELLDNYVRSCLDEIRETFHLQDAWVCMTCLADGAKTMALGEKPPHCQECMSPYIYKVATGSPRRSRFETMCYEIRRYLSKEYPGAIPETKSTEYLLRWRGFR